MEEILQSLFDKNPLGGTILILIYIAIPAIGKWLINKGKTEAVQEAAAINESLKIQMEQATTIRKQARDIELKNLREDYMDRIAKVEVHNNERAMALENADSRLVEQVTNLKKSFDDYTKSQYDVTQRLFTKLDILTSSLSTVGSDIKDGLHTLDVRITRMESTK